jgi:hypothetical protein
VTWTPNADGTLSCPAHPDERPFHGHLGGCAQCAAAPPVDPATATGEGERLCIEAAARGLPDGLEVERAHWNDRKRSVRDAAECRRWAHRLEALAEPLLASGMAEERAEAREWLKLAAAYRGGAHKASDTSNKHTARVAEATALRERQAAKEKRDRLIDRLKGGGSN